MSKVKIAVIGAGWIAQEAFMPAVAQTGNAEITAIVSGSPDKARRLADFHGIKDIYDYSEFDKMATSGNVDAVYIATPNSSHCEYSVRASNHGLHSLVEKPLAISMEQTDQMLAAAKKNNVNVMTAYRLHNDTATIRVAEIIKSGEIGDVRFTSSTFAFQSAVGNHRLDASHWGGPLQDIGVYCLNSARHVFVENPTRVYASSSFGHEDKRFDAVEEGFAVTMEFSKNRMAQFYCGFGSEMAETLQISGTKGAITLINPFRFAVPRKLTVQKGEQIDVIDFEATDDFSGMISYFADCILKGETPLAHGNEGRSDMAALIAIEKSSQTKMPVDLPILPEFKTYDPSILRSFPHAKERLLL